MKKLTVYCKSPKRTREVWPSNCPNSRRVTTKFKHFFKTLRNRLGSWGRNKCQVLESVCFPHSGPPVPVSLTVYRTSSKCPCIPSLVSTQGFQTPVTSCEFCTNLLGYLGFMIGLYSPQYKRVFDTVRCASQNSLSSAESLGSLHSSMGGYVSSSSVPGGAGPRMSVISQGSGSGYNRSYFFKIYHWRALFLNCFRYRRPSSSIYSSSSLGYPSLDSTGQSDSESSMPTTDSEDGYP